MLPGGTSVEPLRLIGRLVAFAFVASTEESASPGAPAFVSSS